MGAIHASSSHRISPTLFHWNSVRTGSPCSCHRRSTLNCTVPLEEVRSLFRASHEELLSEAAAVEPGALTFLPYWAGERTPNWPHATGVIAGLRGGKLTRGGLYRGAMEGATMPFVAGLERLREEFGAEVRGGARRGGGIA